MPSVAPAPVSGIPNREGLPAYDVRWAWAEHRLEPGITAVLRVRNEARNLPWVLPPLLRAVDRLVVVDNTSVDGTREVAREIVAREHALDRVRLSDYPFEVSRCGSENLATPGDSVHSLTHYYNWSFAQVRTSHALKWDGDMVLTEEGATLLQDLGWRLSASDSVVVFPHFPLYVESDRVGYFDVALRNVEPWIYPVGPGFRYVKGFDWEIADFPETATRIVMPEGICFELKWLDAEEFTHWSGTDEFDPQRSPRKVREHLVFNALREGRLADLESVHRVEAPPGTHVIDHVARTWLPGQPRPLRPSRG